MSLQRTENPKSLDEFSYRFTPAQLNELKSRPVSEQETIEFILWSERKFAESDDRWSRGLIRDEVRSLQIIAALRVIDGRQSADRKARSAAELEKIRKMREFLQLHDGKPSREQVSDFLANLKKNKEASETASDASSAGRQLESFKKSKLFNCAVCETEFTAKDVKAKYCSNKCRQRAKYLRSKGGPQERNCNHCGSAFSTNDRRVRYCSAKCRAGISLNFDLFE